ncbi:MAG: hypothetical protein Q4P78_08940 [Rothia sp. (in: high G+C Gram-positive bacteria)]|uniref:hypothetical protein n=1 Tax=Rothia sp. (in: high G+C Gram-positive bacteria) TaxID=1885016 RepID=UPI0026E01EFC|nr:hypothetical protein [Rothia sp. (in: high G+C Gram-positive bacteria)]MDO5751300.1 hypothetical protein [Rothia sp. (in: high G+C Gram-positive bacteria)]
MRSYNDAGYMNCWKVKEVTEIPVSIGSTNYASLALPMAVTIPDGVKAYIGSSVAGGQITLKEVTGGVLPAKTPVILVADEAKVYNFTIAYDNTTAAPKGNKLSGAYGNDTIAEGKTVYGLGIKAETGVGFYKLSNDVAHRTIKANKSYYEAQAADAATMLRFSFGEATGIEATPMQTEAQDTIYYDLQGRRVLYPTHGVYVTGKGQKVYIR